ncbi:quinone oxidoreductase family protein [Tsukamurella pulmonis]|uniref:quinone oxidoreductase family protein n=1 Tax=Tsukamurella pulmonis TaxID=47312 RepID=UPI000E09731D|nr:quinone oxidoreductase [Tsukamurella pulmonis]RDH09546.1 quinone oxidoreductase [Tsukamurella pulmonis]
MANAIRFHETGGPEVLRFEPVDVGEPGLGEVRVRHHAIGLNFADNYYRSGLYPVPLPNGMGVEASGVVQEVGPGVDGFVPGDRVTYTYTGSPLGAYSTEFVLSARHLIHLPDGVDFETAAACTMRGLTAAYLLRRIHDYRPGDTILLHAAAGGVGLIVAQWAKLLGLTVIGTVSTDEKAAAARAAGVDHVIYYRREDTAARVREITGGAGVPVVLDSIGATTFQASLDSLARRGLLVCFGTSSGPIPAIDAMQLAIKGSLFVTRPALADYIADPLERADLAGELFGHIASGRIAVDVHRTYPLADAARAHADLESGALVGSNILIP